MNSRHLWTIVSIVICVTTLAVFHKTVLIGLANWLDVGEMPRAADYVMVLPGGPERRPFVAVSMISQGLVKGILTAETETDPANDEGLYPTNDEVLRRVLALREIGDEQITVLPGKSNSTWTDALSLAKFMSDNPSVTVAIVTDGYHTRRSSWVFRRVLGSTASRTFFVSAPLDSIATASWWTTEDGLNTYLGEYSKLFFYIALDWLVWMAAGFCLACVMLWRRLRYKRPRPQDPGRPDDVEIRPHMA